LSASSTIKPSAWGPEQRRAAIAITFDNLGEASDLERGRWPAGKPLGRHFSVTRALPQVLALLSESRLSATFFVEGVNARLYPEALRTISAADHEVAYHGWRHELWRDLSPARERDLLERGAKALEHVGLRPIGFRPPGGVLSSSPWHALADTGFVYCSPAGDGVGLRDGLAVLPFRWAQIDAFHYLPHFAPRRTAAGAPPDVMTPGTLHAAVSGALRDAVSSGTFLALLFHPFLLDTEDRLAALSAVLNEVRALVDERAAWCAAMREIAAWVLRQPDAGSWALRLDQE
jgi:peptidoglycan/xylan/chitin deacetylase (PgdA/CDA1 family)